MPFPSPRSWVRAYLHRCAYRSLATEATKDPGKSIGRRQQNCVQFAMLASIGSHLKQTALTVKVRCGSQTTEEMGTVKCLLMREEFRHRNGSTCCTQRVEWPEDELWLPELILAQHHNSLYYFLQVNACQQYCWAESKPPSGQNQWAQAETTRTGL